MTTPAHPNTGAGARVDFVRVSLFPNCAYPCWLICAEGPIDYQLGRTYTVFKITLDKAHAAVFVAEKAREIQQGLARLFPATELEPATFEELIEQQTG